MMHAAFLALCVWATSPLLVDAQAQDPRLRFDIAYAKADNFAGATLYSHARCFLRPEVARQLSQAQEHLSRLAPGLHLLLKDCYRPLSVQRRMWRAVKSTPQAPYIANPERHIGAVHTYGAAVDVTLCDSRGKELDMGTPHDFLGALAEPRLEAKHLQSGALTGAQVRNRTLLRKAMLGGGHFHPIRREWWHFDAAQGNALRQRYDRLDVPLASLVDQHRRRDGA